MPKIFISYRREDSQYQADRIHAALRPHFQNPKRDIFIDIDNIPVGVDFVEHLDRKVAEREVLLAVIGHGWLNFGASLISPRKLDDPKDFVRIEIASALKRGVVVVPVLLDGAAMPKDDQLPVDLKPLARRQAIELRRATFDIDAERLIRGLDLSRVPSAKATPTRQKPSKPLQWAIVAMAIGLVLVLGALAWSLDVFHWRT